MVEKMNPRVVLQLKKVGYWMFLLPAALPFLAYFAIQQYGYANWFAWAPFLFVFGFALLAVPAVASVYGLVVSIIGAVRANNGEFYRAPVVIRFVK